MATNYTDTNWCPRCEGTCEVRKCDPNVRSVICSEDCRCPVVKCGLCRGLGYIGCTICGVAAEGDDVQHWRDGEGDWQCQGCATDDGRKPAVPLPGEWVQIKSWDGSWSPPMCVCDADGVLVAEDSRGGRRPIAVEGSEEGAWPWRRAERPAPVEPPRAAFEAFKRGLPYSVTMLHVYLVSQTLGALS